MGQDPRFGPLLALDKVGMYGMSAGGHTALSVAGGRWSPARFRQHCESHISEDFQVCVGLATRLNGNLLDGLKTTAALWVIRYRFSDAAWQTHTDHDPPGFDRAALPGIDRKIAVFFRKHLLPEAGGQLQ